MTIISRNDRDCLPNCPIDDQIVLSIPKMTVQVKNQNDRFQNARYLAFIHRIRKLTVISVLA